MDTFSFDPFHMARPLTDHEWAQLESLWGTRPLTEADNLLAFNARLANLPVTVICMETTEDRAVPVPKVVVTPLCVLLSTALCTALEPELDDPTGFSAHMLSYWPRNLLEAMREPSFSTGYQHPAHDDPEQS